MANIDTNAEEAAKLAEDVKKSTKGILAGTQSIAAAKQSIKDGWRDEGIGDVEEMVNTILKELNAAREPIGDVYKKLARYEAYLRSL